VKYASLDIGTNTFRLLIAEVDGAALKPLLYKRAITRLGGNFTDAGIDVKAAERAFSALTDFRKIISENGVDKVYAAATSVVRRARNRDWFLSEVYKRTGFKLDVISGDEEARLSLLGVMNVIRDSRDRRLVMDIGGGSTEFITTKGGAIRGAWSMEMGVVHLTEKFLKRGRCSSARPGPLPRLPRWTRTWRPTTGTGSTIIRLRLKKLKICISALRSLR
jgi:exopolyphosphatase/guanosine-5'-triphosphate,3'-diphosphate pyrophosphatase